MSDRGQVAADPFPIVTLVIGFVVAMLVGREVWSEQQSALEQCAPNCDLGGPIFAFPDSVKIAVVVGTLFVAGVMSIMIRRRATLGGDGDE